VPILIDRDGNVIAGHGRLLAARELGLTEVPTLCLDHLTSAQARVFMIADNRLTEIATWDDRLLAQQLKDLSLIGLDFSLELTGFEMAEIDLRIASLDDVADRADDPADAVPDVPAGPPGTKIGDVWLLDRHRLLCGSALDAAAFAALIGAERAAMVFTDPPYNVPIDGHASGLGAIHHRPFPMASGKMDRSEFTAFLGGAFRNLAAFSHADEVQGPVNADAEDLGRWVMPETPGWKGDRYAQDLADKLARDCRSIMIGPWVSADLSDAPGRSPASRAGVHHHPSGLPARHLDLGASRGGHASPDYGSAPGVVR
jgi:hypothetical protein